jgi:hypothetical protein
MRRSLCITALLAASLGPLAATPPALAAPAPGGAAAATCPADTKTVKRIYGIGSSTMGMELGRILKSELRARGAKVRIWGKASSGLARPDFHDWPAAVPRLVRAHKPELFVVSLGTNDAQNLFNDGHWYEFGGRHWKRIYAARVDRLLGELSGPDKHRPVVWLGPTTLPGKLGHERVKLISSVIRRRIAAFGGPVRFIDGVAQTTDAKGAPLARVKVPGRKRHVVARAGDNVHLTEAGVRWLLAEPILAALAPCLPRTAQASNHQVAAGQ